MSLYKVIAALCLVLSVIPASTACCSYFDTVEEQYCHAEWVFSVKVKAEGELEDGNMAYPIDVLKVNKYPNFMLTPSKYPRNVLTVGNPAEPLVPGAYYILSGWLQQQEDGTNIFITVSICPYRRTFTEVEELRKYKLPNCRKYFKFQD